jgi:glucose/mannose-6-phosphate isomerase
MNLNDISTLRGIDRHNLIAHIDALPDQLQAAWAMAQRLSLPERYRRIERIVIAGNGEGISCGEMVSTLVADLCNLPILIVRGYDLPAYADGQATLVIVISHAGTDEEALAVTELADARGTKLIGITGVAASPLAEKLAAAGGECWVYQTTAPERAAYGWSIGLLVGLIARLGLIRDMQPEIDETVGLLRRFAALMTLESVVVKNPAKRLAGQFIGRTALIYGAGLTAPVARRWKIQINRNGKALAQAEELPEMTHHALAGMNYPTPLMTKVAICFLVAEASDHPRITQRWNLLRTMYLEEGFASDTIKTRGTSRLAQMLTVAHYGDYVSYYIALAYGIDPTETLLVNDFNERLAILPPV